MESSPSNCCLNVLYEIRDSLAYDRIRNEWFKFRQKYPKEIELDKEKVTKPLRFCDDYCLDYDSNFTLPLTYNKLIARISEDTCKKTMAEYLNKGIFTFYLDLFYGSANQNLEAIVRLQEVALDQAGLINFSIPLSIFLKISPREHFTGKFKRNKSGVTLKKDRKVTLSVDRKYASYSCHSIIYVNAKFLVHDLRKCDIICIGDTVQLQVEGTQHFQIFCKVIFPGRVTTHMPVRFPCELSWTHEFVSAEEIEDITFAMGTNINVIASRKPMFQSLKETMCTLGCQSFYLFTFLKLKDLEKCENARNIWKGYDGFILDCEKEPPDNRVVRLPTIAKEFIEKIYNARKPLLLKGCWSKIIHPSDYLFAFYYPEKYMIPCSAEFLRLFEAIFHKLGPDKCTDLNFHDKSLTGSCSIARSIVASSYDFEADVIVMCTVIGYMVEKIAHFRPNTPIVAVTHLPDILNYGSLHHNVWMLAHDVQVNDAKKSHKKITYEMLVYGLMFAVHKGIVTNHSAILLVFRRKRSYGFTDRFAVMRYTDNYEETIKDIILKR